MSGYMTGATLLLGVFATGCATNRDFITNASISTKSDIFTEAIYTDFQTAKAIIDFEFTVKSNSYYLMGTYGKHSAPPYRVHLNIDGQATVLEAEPVLEDKSPINSNEPESGIGWKYQFSKRIALAPGKHKLTIALPIDGVIVEREVNLHAGANSISVHPTYSRRNLRPYKGENFTAGVKSLDITVK